MRKVLDNAQKIANGSAGDAKAYVPLSTCYGVQLLGATYRLYRLLSVTPLLFINEHTFDRVKSGAVLGFCLCICELLYTVFADTFKQTGKQLCGLVNGSASGIINEQSLPSNNKKTKKQKKPNKQKKFVPDLSPVKEGNEKASDDGEL